jgi:hypothetical protein
MGFNPNVPVARPNVAAMLQVQHDGGMQVHGMPSAQELMVYQTWAKNAVDSQMYRGVGKESAVMMIMLAAREYGIGPAQALNGGLHIIEGKVELSARVMSALIRRAKHTLQILESTDQICKIKGTRADTGETHTVTFTIEMAQKAGLIKEKGGWKRTPEDMLYARCVSRLARQLFSDVIGIGYIEGEISDSRANGEVLEHVPEISEDAIEKMIQDLLQHFDVSDHGLVMTFINEINAHYKELKVHTLMKLLNDIKVTSDQFHKWKNKRKLNEKVIDITNAASTPSE